MGAAVGIATGIVVVIAGGILMAVKGLTGGVKSSKLHPDNDAEYKDVESADTPKQLKWKTTNGPPRSAFQPVILKRI